MGGLYLAMEFHHGGSAMNEATPSSFKCDKNFYLECFLLVISCQQACFLQATGAQTSIIVPLTYSRGALDANVKKKCDKCRMFF